MQGVELEHEQRETINWDDLTPPCGTKNCPNPGTLIVEHRHFQDVNCSFERRKLLICQPCYDRVRSKKTACLSCNEPASYFSV